MEEPRLRVCLDTDFRRLRTLVGRGGHDKAVPTCPGWTLAGLARHVGAVYLHKVECMRLGRPPDPWPPADLDEQPPGELLDRAYAALVAEFDVRAPSDPAYTWYEPDQTVGFWIRRMAQETVIHRVDAELAVGASLDPIPDDLAVDGVDEVLAFVEFGTATWPEEFAGQLAAARGRTVRVSTPQRSWLLRLSAEGARVDDAAPGQASATVEGPASDVLLRLWNRGGDAVRTSGDTEVVALLGEVLTTSTQ